MAQCNAYGVECEDHRSRRTHRPRQLRSDPVAGAKVPGVLFQGDSLSILVANLRQSRAQLQDGDRDDGIGSLELVLDDLEAAQRKYEAALAEHSIPLPY